MPIERKKTLNVFKDARGAWGSYDDFPVGPAGTDPMPHLSRNRVPQPFFLVSEGDQVLIQMAGEGEIQFREIEPRAMRLQPGDTVYIPAGVPSRLLPQGENVQIRLKVEPSVREAVAWYCDGCDGRVHAVELPHTCIVQEEYWRAVIDFNGDPQSRTCSQCGRVHPPAELGDIAWPEVAAARRAAGD
jgi:mannose-6-phosphate isomerase-like protein (cupin superfamily)